MAITKDPASTLDYGRDWTLWLGGDTITESTWRVEGPAAVDPDVPLAIDGTKADTFDGKQTKVWLTGGVPGVTYALVNRIQTAAGRIDERTLQISVRQK